jgi:hypothetical protein
MKQCLFEFRPHFRTDRHQNEDDVHEGDPSPLVVRSW